MATTTEVRTLTLNQAINEAIRQEMQRDPSVIVIGEDVAGGAGRAEQGILDGWSPSMNTRGLIAEFGPGRVIDAPISEMGFVGVGVGAAMTGLRPIVDLTFIDLMMCAYDQIANQAAKMHYMMGGTVNVPLTIRMSYGSRGGGGQTYGGGAAAQHSQTLYAALAHIPGLKIVTPTTAYNAKGLMTSAIRDNSPVVFLDHKFLGAAARAEVPAEPYTIPIGQSQIVRPGADLTLCGIGKMTHVCLEAAEQLAASGIDAEVIDLLTLVPLDEATLFESVRRTHRLVVVDEDTPTCSMARDIAARVADTAFDDLDAPVKTIMAADTPVPFSAVLEAAYVPRAQDVVQVASTLIGR